MIEEVLNIAEIKNFQPLSRSFKKIDKYFKYSTLHDLRAKLERNNSHRKGLVMKEFNMDSGPKLPLLKKENNFFIKVNLEKEKKERDLRSQTRADKIDILLKKRTIIMQEVNDSMFPGKYEVNQSSIAGKARVILNNTVIQQIKKTSKEKLLFSPSNHQQSISKLGESEEIIRFDKSEKLYNERLIGQKASSKILKVSTKKVNNVDHKELNGFGSCNKGIKFELYASRDIVKIVEDFEYKPKLIIPSQLKINNVRSKRNTQKAGHIINFDNNTLSLLRRSKSVITKRTGNPQMNFNKMIGRGDKQNSKNIPDALIYQPNLDSVRARSRSTIIYDCKPSCNLKYKKKICDNSNSTKRLQIEAYLANQESKYKQRRLKHCILDHINEF